MTLVAQTRPFVIGVDCHARTHTYSVIEASTRRQVASEQFPTTAAGISRALAWAGRRTGGDMGCLWAIEGVGTYGARLARAVVDAGYDVAEAPRMNAPGRRGLGKSDALDAAAIGTAVLSVEESELRAHDLGIDARKPLVPPQIATIARWRDRQEKLEVSIAREEAVRLAPGLSRSRLS